MSDPADLSNLRDIIVPPAVASWPPAPGWWILAATAVAAGAILAAMAMARHRRNAYRREALRALEEVEPQGISGLLKRTALGAWPREQVAPLSGPAWLAFLDRTGRTRAFTTGEGQAIETLAFGGDVPTDQTIAVRDAARDWLRHHRTHIVIPSAARDL